MATPRIAIVGRPNVGKSSLFNWIARRRISIVEPTAGVTRDRISTLIQIGDRYVELIDTGGMGIEDSDNLTGEVERQIQLALDQADVLLFVVDARDGIKSLDEEVNRRLRYVNKPIIAVANKCDTETLDGHAADFYRLGRGAWISVSAEQRRGREALMTAIEKNLPPEDNETAPRDAHLKIAIVGKRNTGKSTFINSLAQAERVIVSEVAGTTRDSVDVRFERDGQTFVAIDTAGVRRKQSVSSSIEFYSVHRAERSIRRSDVVLMFLDPRARVSKVDKTLTEYILEEFKPAVFVVNKWDLVKDSMPTERFANYVRATFPMLDFVPIAFITAKSGKNVHKLLNLTQNLFKQASARVSTGDLNRVLVKALEDQPPPMRFNRRPKVFYATQATTNPPTIIIFTNGPHLFDPTYLRYLMKNFRDNLPFLEVPIRLHLRTRSRLPKPDEEKPVETAIEKPTRKPKSDDKRPRGKAKESDLWRDL